MDSLRTGILIILSRKKSSFRVLVLGINLYSAVLECEKFLKIGFITKQIFFSWKLGKILKKMFTVGHCGLVDKCSTLQYKVLGFCDSSLLQVRSGEKMTLVLDA